MTESRALPEWRVQVMQMLGAGCHPLIGLRGGNVCGVLSEEQGRLCGRRVSETEREREESRPCSTHQPIGRALLFQPSHWEQQDLALRSKRLPLAPVLNSPFLGLGQKPRDELANHWMTWVRDHGDVASKVAVEMAENISAVCINLGK